MKKIYLFAALAAMLAACSENDLTKETAVQQNAEEGAVTFDAYTQRATTRAGSVEIMKDASLRDCGFGVFGFYTNNSDYDPQSIPNFFYNQKVEYKGGVWTYAPVKYWPNEYGDDAVSDDNDRVSYFAYAPYVDVVASTGKLVKDNLSDADKWGITGMSRNSAQGDPLIKYIASFDQDKAVDLIWGVCDNPDWSIIQGGTKQEINDGEYGLPWLNVLRPQEVANQRLKFTFKHALSQLSVNVDAFIDGYNNANELKSSETRIFIRSISFQGFTMKGSLNLNNTEKDKANWLDYNGTNDLETGEWVTIYDGRKDGKEGATGSTATNEKMLGLNPQFIQDVEWYSDKVNKTVNAEMAAGVTNTPATLFRIKVGDTYAAATRPALVIPTGEDMEVEIVYDIETVDNNLSTYVSDGNTQGSSIENRIRKTINFGEKGLENGKHYTVNLHLGLNSVKFDAEVSDWVEAAVSPEADLPSNMPTFAVSTTPSEIKVDWDYATATATTKEYLYAITGFNGGEAVSATTNTGCTVTINSKPDFSGTASQANASGVAYVKVEITTANNNVIDNATPVVATVTGGVSTKAHTLKITQLARPLGLSVSSVTDNTIVLAKANAGAWDAAATGGTPAASMKVLKNGVEMAKNTTPAPGTYKFANGSGGTGTITLGTNLVAGDIYTITVKTGDAAEETVVARIGGILFSPNTATTTYSAVAGNFQKEPMVYGQMASYTYSEASASDYVSVANANTGTITTDKGGGDATIKCVATAATPANGWFYTTTTLTSTYTLTVNKQRATLSFIGAPTEKTASEVNSKFTVTATQTADIDGTPDGTITYSIEYTKATGSTATKYEVSSTGEVSVDGTAFAGDTFTVTAKISADTDKYTFGSTLPVTTSYTVIIK